MTNDTSIEQKNKAIFEFEGRSYDDATELFGYPDYQLSWTLLMPVVEKIEGIKSKNKNCFGTSVEISGCHCSIKMGLPFRTMDSTKCDYFEGYTGHSKIEAVHYLVHHFILWFNSIHKQTINL